MIVRALDVDNDWTFGKGRNNYYKNRDALKQLIKTRLKEFLGDCFWAVSEGIDWFNLLGGKDATILQLSVNSVILNTDGVTGIIQLSSNYAAGSRKYTLSYAVQTIYGIVADDFQLDPGGTV